jgi:hypothetical protein
VDSSQLAKMVEVSISVFHKSWRGFYTIRLQWLKYRTCSQK